MTFGCNKTVNSVKATGFPPDRLRRLLKSLGTQKLVRKMQRFIVVWLPTAECRLWIVDCLARTWRHKGIRPKDSWPCEFNSHSPFPSPQTATFLHRGFGFGQKAKIPRQLPTLCVLSRWASGATVKPIRMFLPYNYIGIFTIIVYKRIRFITTFILYHLNT